MGGKGTDLKSVEIGFRMPNAAEMEGMMLVPLITTGELLKQPTQRKNEILFIVFAVSSD